MLESITELLKSTTTNDHFCTSLSIPLDGLEIVVDGAGNISNGPLTKWTIKSLIKEAQLASFGWRDQTVVDTRVRNVWEITKDKIKLSNRDFNHKFSGPLDKIKRDLGLADQGKLTAELHNLLIYEPGQFFSTHQDLEKADGMIATMTVILPSSFMGGSLVIEQQDDKKVFKAPKMDNKHVAAIAFYADCHHEVTKVTDGHRIALTFNLSLEVSGENSDHPTNATLNQQLKQYFSTKKANSQVYRRPHPRWFIYLLDHQYSQKGLSWDYLKGCDRKRAALLKGAAADLDLTLHLALAELHETWTTEEEYDRGYGRYSYHFEEEEEDGSRDLTLGELIEDNYSLDHWLDSDGKNTGMQRHSAPNEMFCWTKAVDDFEPFRSEHEGYMGNYGNTLDRWYHRAAIVLWPMAQDFSSWFAIDPSRTFGKVKDLIKKDSLQGKKILKKLTTQISDLHSGELAEVGNLLEIANLVADPTEAKKLLEILNLGTVNYDNSDQLFNLNKSYGQDWFVETLNNWSNSDQFHAEHPRDLLEIITLFKNHPEITEWLLVYQFKLIIRSDKVSEKHSGSAEIDKSLKGRVDKACNLILAANIARKKTLANKIIGHALKFRRVYPSIGLAQIAERLAKDSVDSHQVETLAKEATLRLTQELAFKRVKDDVSINEELPCACGDCKDLKKFLRSKTENKIVWPLAKDRRGHIHQMIDSMGFGITHITQRTGSPHKLILTKQASHFAKEAKKRREAEKYLKSIQKL